MFKLIFVLSIMFAGIANASPYMMGKYLDGEISADQYLDNLGCPPRPIVIQGPYGGRYTVSGG